MRAPVSALTLLLGLHSVLAYSQSQVESPAASAILVNAGRLLDVRKGTYIDNAGIWIERGRIKEVGPISQVGAHAPANAEMVDLSRATVLPGLIDCHTHLLAGFGGTPNSYLLDLATKSQALRALEGAANARVTLRAGFTTVRDVENEGSGYADVALGLAGPQRGGRSGKLC